MEFFTNFSYAFSVATEPINLLACFGGVLVGTLVGVLPGLGPIAAMSLLMPITFGMTTAQAIIMLSGIYYGAYYGGSTTSILVNIPGEVASVVTCLDGYQMARKGRAGMKSQPCIVHSIDQFGINLLIVYVEELPLHIPHQLNQLIQL